MDPLALFEAAEDPIAFDDVERNLLFANKAFRRLFGIAEDEPLGRLDRFIAPSSLPGMVERHVRRMQGDHAIPIYEFEGRRSDGAALWLEASVIPVSREGEIIGSCAILRDVTDRREGRRAVRQAQQQYRSLFEQAFDAIIVFEPGETIVLDVNPRACELYGLRREEFIGKSLLTRSTQPQSDREALAGLRAGEPIHDLHTVHRYVDGSELYLECNASLIDWEGRDAVLAINRDITERRRLQQQLTHAEKMQGIGRLAAGVAHEFNNVLAAILGTAEALLDEIDDPRSRSLLEQMVARGRAGGEVTRELLALSRKPSGSRVPISLDGCVGSMGSLLGSLLGDGIELRKTTQATGAAVLAHPGQLEQVIVNLAINARDAMEGQGTLFLRTSAIMLVTPMQATTHRLESGSYAILEVCDTGPGIPPDAVAQVFEPFYTTKAQGEGTGLGLSMVYSIVDQLGGAIEVRNEGGACFTIHLPICDEVPAEVERPAPPAETPGTTILVVDDETIIVASLARGLRRLGYDVLTAPDANEAREQLAKHRVDLLLTDLSMPGGGGIELARDAVIERPEIKVLLMSGYAERALPPELAKARFVQKPFARAALVQRIRELLDEA